MRQFTRYSFSFLYNVHARTNRDTEASRGNTLSVALLLFPLSSSLSLSLLSLSRSTCLRLRNQFTKRNLFQRAYSLHLPRSRSYTPIYSRRIRVRKVSGSLDLPPTLSPCHFLSVWTDPRDRDRRSRFCDVVGISINNCNFYIDSSLMEALENFAFKSHDGSRCKAHILWNFLRFIHLFHCILKRNKITRKLN